MPPLVARTSYCCLWYSAHLACGLPAEPENGSELTCRASEDMTLSPPEILAPKKL